MRIEKLSVLAVFSAALLCGSAAAIPPGCALSAPGGTIQHVIYIQFDNLHLEREFPNVPSDLEQMPHLYNFMKANGTILTNHHTPLIAHTADDILTSLTGVYGERHGQAVANSYVNWNAGYPGSYTYWDSFPSSFTYWTDQVYTNPAQDNAYNMITSTGANAPAPWVPFTKAGCNVGAVSIANMEVENTAGDLVNLYGNPSPEYSESSTNKVLDFEGIAIHCAATDSTICTGAHAKTDLLPSEPGGYIGFKGLFGHKYVVPQITSPSSTTFNDLTGAPVAGFPGFGGISPAQTLGYAALMLEKGIPVIFSYISDAHDCHASTGAGCGGGAGYRAFGPGEAAYVAQLAAYDHQFDLFFQRLANDGITTANTLFVISSDEQDHFAGAAPSNPGCDGVTTPCTYTYASTIPGVHTAGASSIGEAEVDLQALFASQFPLLVPSVATASSIFDFHYDMAPAMYFQGKQSAAGSDPLLRSFERAAAQLTAVNPITGATDKLALYQVDRVGMKALHMITGDPQRTPNFVTFDQPLYYFQGAYGGACTGAARTNASCLTVQAPGYAWNHGGIAPEINVTWVGMVGPGVKAAGFDKTTWTDETDVRPTMLALTGLSDDYISDGRVVVEDLGPGAFPAGIKDPLFPLLAGAYKQLNAPLGQFGQVTLQVSTKALAASDSGDATYTALENRLAALTTQRDTLAGTIKTFLDGVEFHGQPLDHPTATSLLTQAQQLLWQAQVLQTTGH